MNALVAIPQNNAEIYRASTDAASLCREIVLATAMEIQDRKYVKVEGWQAIAIAHGCTASARDVERVEGGVRAIGEVRRMSDGAVIAEAEGFVGEDEPTWYGGSVEKDEWVGPKGNRRKTGKKITTVLPKRADYAIRAMAQTRAISRACRSAFAHVVVLIDANLSTTPAEEVPEGGFHDASYEDVAPREERSAPKPAEKPMCGALKAAKPMIDALASMDAIRGWEANNEAALRKLDNEDYIEVMSYLRAHEAKVLASTGAGDFGDLDDAATTLTGKAA